MAVGARKLMAARTDISWADSTWNAWIGCTEVSPACDFCYARRLAERYGWAKWGDHPRHRTAASTWAAPFAWNRKAEKTGTRPFVFTNSLADMFDNQVDPEWRADAFKLMRETPNLVWLLLTKRPRNIVRMVKEVGFMPPNIAFGATCEDRERAERNLPALMGAAGLCPLFLFMSAEPLLEDLGDLSPWLSGNPALGWVITGGESGPHARPTPHGAFRSIRDQCARFGTPFHHKQNGEWIAYDQVRWLAEATQDEIKFIGLDIRVGAKRSGRLLDGVLHDARPALPPIQRAAA